MAITNGYASLAQVKAAMRIPTADTVDDALIETAIESASRQIDGHCQRRFYTTSATRIYTPNDSYITEIDDLVTLTSIKTQTDIDGTFDTTWKTTDYQLEPLNGMAGGLNVSYTQIRAVGDFLFPVYGGEATVQVTGTFGWASVPSEIKQACIILSQRQYKRYDSPLGVAGIGEIGVIRVSRIDPDVASILAPYRRIRMA
jgi:hypothetical protein